MSELWASIMEWVASRNPGRLDHLDGLWRGETSEWLVEVNGHRKTIEGLPPLSVKLSHKVFFALGIIDPSGGALTGAKERDLIEYFRNAAREAKP